MAQPIPPVTPASIAKAIADRDAERLANGIVCDADGKIIVVDQKRSA
jgi:hypothetical protein